MNVSMWISEVNQLMRELENVDIGYPLGKNTILPVADNGLLNNLMAKTGLQESSELIAFYKASGGAVFEDIHIGYFLHPLELILRGIQNGEPVRVTGPVECNIVVFGTDGGGGRFAMWLDGSGAVLHLPNGAVHDGTFDGERTPFTLLSGNYFAFLERLLLDIRAFVRGEPDWKYMV